MLEGGVCFDCILLDSNFYVDNGKLVMFENVEYIVF